MASSGKMEQERQQPLSERDETVSLANQEQSSPAEGLKKNLHGSIFQVKLLTLFCVRGLLAGYSEFKLDTENPKLAGKFDDVIFYYNEKNSNDVKIR